MIKLIALDYDWTMLDYTKGKPVYCKKLFDYLNKFISGGGEAGIVSGRPYHEMRDALLAQGFGWRNPFPTFTVYRESYISVRDDTFARFNEENKLAIMRLMRSLLPYAPVWMDRFEKNGLTVTAWKIMSDYSLEYSLPNIEQAQTAYEMLGNFIAEEGLRGCAVQRNGSLAAVYYEKCGKGNMLKAVADYLGFHSGEVLAIGDSLNDLSMIDGGFGFHCGTPENGDAKIKEAVSSKGGIIGAGTAYDGVLDIFGRYEKSGLIMPENGTEKQNDNVSSTSILYN